MIALFPYERGALRPQLLLQQCMVSPDIVAYAGDGLVLHMFFLLAQTQINISGQRQVLPCKGQPAVYPYAKTSLAFSESPTMFHSITTGS